jgi:hypothetical protein
MALPYDHTVALNINVSIGLVTVLLHEVANLSAPRESTSPLSIPLGIYEEDTIRLGGRRRRNRTWLRDWNWFWCWGRFN